MMVHQSYQVVVVVVMAMAVVVNKNAVFAFAKSATDLLCALRWPNATVPVEVPDGVLAPDHWHALQAAMHCLNGLTCLSYVNATREPYRVIVKPARGCGSLVGHVGVGDAQTLHLGAQCFLQKGTVLHELLHVAGLFHEHTRPDRDQYVRVMWTNIQQNKFKNYAVRPWAEEGAELLTLGLPYDYGSVMHYSPDMFTVNKTLPSLTLRRPYTGLVGQREAPSRTDVARVNRLYECWEHYLGDDLPGATAYHVWHAAALYRILS